MTTVEDFGRSLLSILLLLCIILICWIMLWKFILSKNPLIRDFFDLDTKNERKQRKS